MPEKKKTPANKSEEKRVAKPPAARPGKPEPAGAANPASALGAREQFSAFEAAMKQFHGRHMAQARELFERAAAGPERDVANRARVHMAMCDRRLQQEPVELQSAEDYYTYGVALINTRKLAEARQNLERALAMTPQADHIHYALALAQALGGDLEKARSHLERAIELEPRNRMIARQDADFALIARHPMFDALLYPEKKGW
ncbi:MAG: tetratricopeptide repeat protein [Bryobacteraceae bacterium]